MGGHVPGGLGITGQRIGRKPKPGRFEGRMIVGWDPLGWAVGREGRIAMGRGARLRLSGNQRRVKQSNSPCPKRVENVGLLSIEYRYPEGTNGLWAMPTFPKAY